MSVMPTLSVVLIFCGIYVMRIRSGQNHLEFRERETIWLRFPSTRYPAPIALIVVSDMLPIASRFFQATTWLAFSSISTASCLLAWLGNMTLLLSIQNPVSYRTQRLSLPLPLSQIHSKVLTFRLKGNFIDGL